MAFFGGIPPDNYMYKYCIRFWLRPQFNYGWSPTFQATKTHLGEAQAARSPSWARAIVWRIQWFCLMAVKRCATATREMAKTWDVHAVNQAKKTPCHKLYQLLSFQIGYSQSWSKLSDNVEMRLFLNLGVPHTIGFQTKRDQCWMIAWVPSF